MRYMIQPLLLYCAHDLCAYIITILSIGTVRSNSFSFSFRVHSICYTLYITVKAINFYRLLFVPSLPTDNRFHVKKTKPKM